MSTGEDCIPGIIAACEKALQVLEEASETIGKGRGSGGGLARLLREAGYELGDAATKCIRGCGESVEPRCVIGEVVDRLQAVMHGAALRLERIGRIGSIGEEELARMLIDVFYSIISSICRYASRL